MRLALEGTDFLQFLAEDCATRVIAIYCEEIRRPAEFLAACRPCARLPVKTDRADVGRARRQSLAKRRSSHTGAPGWRFGSPYEPQAENAGAIVVSHHGRDDGPHPKYWARLSESARQLGRAFSPRPVPMWG